MKSGSDVWSDSAVAMTTALAINWQHCRRCLSIHARKEADHCRMSLWEQQMADRNRLILFDLLHAGLPTFHRLALCTAQKRDMRQELCIVPPYIFCASSRTENQPLQTFKMSSILKHKRYEELKARVPQTCIVPTPPKKPCASKGQGPQEHIVRHS